MKFSVILKISFMILALFGVLRVMNNLDSGAVEKQMSSPNSALGLLIGADCRPVNWCAEQTVKVEIYNPANERMKELNDAAGISATCEIMACGISDANILETSFYTNLVSTNKLGETKKLERHGETNIFRFDGMPVSSPSLSKALKRISESQ